ncbi:hypothetical protein AB9K34_21800 [Sedimentitalea sp. XS_ASV28]|uniref:hypothetical protein n=1 Tax=Sedimentitalea sp. XS_ASV28 TaxID=3241296 RepID=UPI003514BFE2
MGKWCLDAKRLKGVRTVKRARDIRDFDDPLYQIKDDLAETYLAPLGLTRLKEAA